MIFDCILNRKTPVVCIFCDSDSRFSFFDKRFEKTITDKYKRCIKNMFASFFFNEKKREKCSQNYINFDTKKKLNVSHGN